MNLQGKRVLVTGGTGFLGRHVCHALWSAGGIAIPANSTDFDLQEAHQVQSMIKHSRPDLIVHLAAACGGIGFNASEWIIGLQNLLIGTNILNAACCPMLLAGTVCSYPANCPVPFIESEFWNGFPEPTNAPYGIAKKAISATSEECDVAVTNLVISNLYGPGDHFDLERGHVIPAIIRKVCEAKAAGADSITLWGDGTPTRDFLYVEDAAKAIVRALEVRDDPSIVNIGTGIETSISDVARMVCEIVGWDGCIEWDTSKPNGQQRRCLDISKAKAEMGWEPTVGLQDGLRRTVEWYQNQ